MSHIEWAVRLIGDEYEKLWPEGRIYECEDETSAKEFVTALIERGRLRNTRFEIVHREIPDWTTVITSEPAIGRAKPWPPEEHSNEAVLDRWKQAKVAVDPNGLSAEDAIRRGR